jgi:hypothetical protein
MTTHIPTANPRVRYQIAADAHGYLVTRCRYDDGRWWLQLAHRVPAPTYEQARGIAARLAATERNPAQAAPLAVRTPRCGANGAKTTNEAHGAGDERTGAMVGHIAAEGGAG